MMRKAFGERIYLFYIMSKTNLISGKDIIVSHEN